MNKLIPWLITLIALFSAYEAVMFAFSERSHSKRILHAFDASRETVEYYKTKSGNEAARVKVLQLQYNEMKSLYPEIIQRLRNLEIKPSRVEVYSHHTLETIKEISVPLKDTVINNVPAKKFNYKDPWHLASGIIKNDSVFQTIHTFDTIDQAIYRGKRKNPKLWIFSKRQLEQSIALSNPNNHITYSRVIKITKQ